MKSIFIFLILISSFAWGHPVTFKNGQEIQFNQFSDMTKLSYNYSFSNNQALGFSFLRMEIDTYSLIDYNHLVKRWNNFHSQANFYTGISLGLKNSENLTSGAFIEMDWESRRYYVSSKVNFLENDLMTKNRIGLAPYVAKYEQLNTWLMVEHVKVNHMNLEEVNFLARFYYKNYLWELGMGTKDNYLFNFMIHY